ncbi:MAG: Ig-like domain-containing protein, partial [Bacteroidota bacterium]
MQQSLQTFLFFVIGITFSLGALAQQTQVLGSMPKDGADGLLRNVVISVGLDFADAKVGIDPKTLNAKNIRLYPSSRPNILIESFVIADENNASLIIEPSQLLAPNTQYTFEISQGLRDQAGNSFGPYKIKFRTGAKSIPKRISTDRPKIVHQTRKVYWQPKKEIFVEPTIATRPVKTEKQPLPEEASAVVAETRPEIPKTTDNPENTDLTQNANTESTNDSQNEKVDEKTQSVASQSIKEDERSPEEKTKIEERSNPERETKSLVEEIEKEEAITVASIHFPSTKIALKGKLPVSFRLPDNSPIQYIVKNTRGEVVKKGSGKLFAGKHDKFLS